MSGEGSGWRDVRPRTAAWIVLAGTIASFVYTYPLALHLREAIPYGYGVSPERRVQALVPGDHLQFFYALSLTDDMVHGRVPWFEDPYQFSAPRPSGRKSFFFLPFSLLFSAAAPLGRATAYNLLVLLSFPATALATFLLARRVGLATAGAAVAATALTILPYRLANVAGGHPTGIAFFLLPLALYFLETAWQRESRRSAAGAGFSFLCLAVNEPHFFYFFVLLVPLWLSAVAWRLEPARRPALGAGFGWILFSALGPTAALAVEAVRRREVEWTPASLAGLFAVSVILLAVLWRATVEARARAGDEAWKEEARSFWPLAILLLSPVQLRLGMPYLGLLLVAATLVALAVAKRPLLRALAVLAWHPPGDAALRRLAVLWPAALGFAAGLFLLLQYKASFIDPAGHAGGRSLREIGLFAPWPSDFLERSGMMLTRQLYPGAAVAVLALVALATPAGRALVLVAVAFGALALGPHAPPWLPLHPIALRVMPFFGIIRQPGKLFAVTALAAALAAGFGIGWLARKLGGGRASAAVAAAAIAAMLVDFAAVLPFGVSRLPKENAAYDEVARRAAGSNLLELTIWPGDSAYSSIYEYWALRTRVPVVNGYSATAPRDYVQRVARPLESMNLGELDESQHRLLDESGVRLVTLHRDTYPPHVYLYPYRFALAAMRRDPNLAAIAADDGVHLFERTAGPYRTWDATTPWPMGALFEAEALKVGAGERTEDDAASAGVFVRARPGKELPVVFGPYRPLPRGRYEVRFRVRGRGRVEVSADFGKVELASSSVDLAQWGEVPLELSVAAPTTVELRAWQAAPAEPALDVDWVLVTKTDGAMPGEQSTRFEAEDLTARYGVDREAPEASGGAYAVVVDYPPDAVARDGPWRIYDPGVLRLTARSRGGAFRLRLESADGRRLFGDLRVPARADWATFVADVELPEREIVCTRLVSARVLADVDYVEITRRERGEP